MSLEKSAIRNLVFGILLSSLLFGNRLVAEEASNMSGEEPASEVIPYSRVCMLNYGFNFDFHLGGKQTFQRGEGRFNSDNENDGTLIDLEDDLGLDRSSSNFFIGLDFNIYAFRLSYDYTYSIFDGDRTLQQNVTIDGTTYVAGSELDSSIRMDWNRFILGYSVFTLPNLAFGFDVAFDVIRVKYKFEGTQLTPLVSVTEEDTKYLPVPKIGVHLDFSFADPLVFTLSVNGIDFDQSDIHGTSIYAELNGRWYFGESFFFFLQTAYDYQNIESDRDDRFNGEVKLNTWFLSTGMGFFF